MEKEREITVKDKLQQSRPPIGEWRFNVLTTDDKVYGFEDTRMWFKLQIGGTYKVVIEEPGRSDTFGRAIGYTPPWDGEITAII